MQEHKREDMHLVIKKLRRLDAESPEAHQKRVIQFCRAADAEAAERMVTNGFFRAHFYTIQDEKESVIAHLLRKALSNKTPEQLFQFLIAELPGDQSQIYKIELRLIMIEQLRNNLEFRKLFLSSPASNRIEVVLFQYCDQHGTDLAMKGVCDEYRAAQSTAEMVKMRQADIEDGFRAIYGFPKSPYVLSSHQKDIVQIAQFMIDLERIDLRLKELEGLIEKKAKSESQSKSSDEKSTEASKLQGKLLSSQLYALAETFGFNEHLKIGEDLSSADFYRMLKEKRLFKDTAQGGDRTFHGEWVHFIQWMCIALESQSNRDFLKNPVAAIYQWIGEQAETPAAIKGLWGQTFDGGPARHFRVGEPQLDCRNPFAFDKYLRTSTEATASYPLMQQLLQNRAQKRTQQRTDDATVDQLRTLCSQHPESSQVKDLQATLEAKRSTGDKLAKSAKLLQQFGIYYREHKPQLPREFVSKVEKHLPALGKGKKE